MKKSHGRIRTCFQSRVFQNAFLPALRIGFIYLAVGVIWILASDTLLSGRLHLSASDFALWSTLKGFFYVLTSAVIFVVLIFIALRRADTARQRAEALNADLRKTNTLLSAIWDSSPDVAVFSINRDLLYTSYNKSYKALVESISGNFLHIGSDIFRVIDDPDIQSQLRPRFTRALAGHTVSVTEAHTDKAGRTTYWQKYYTPIFSGVGDVTGVAYFSLNVTALKRAEAENLFLSYHDKLTGLFNRRYYEMTLERIEHESYRPICVIMGDVNGLKLVNDAFGHAAGDELLQVSAKILSSLCGSKDTLARWGGDEFILLLPDADGRRAADLICRVKKRLSCVTLHALQPDISFGWAVRTDETQDMRQVVKTAEDYMYRQKMLESKSMRSHTVTTILQTLHEKNPREAEHSQRVGDISYRIALAMGYDEEQAKSVYIAGYLHDIGKIAIADGLLDKPGALTENEFAAMRKHPEIGCRIIESSYEYSEFTDAILSHHERWDGNGYPKGLKGKDIPLYACIICVADSFDAMTSVRPYRDCWSPRRAGEEIRRCAGTQFDPEIALLFVDKILRADETL